MGSIIRQLYSINQWLISLVLFLLEHIASISKTKDKLDIYSPKYKKLTIDKPPVIKVVETTDYKKILAETLILTGKPIKPVARRKVSTVPHSAVCPHCGAPHNYLYDNSGARGQLLCKVCGTTFFLNDMPIKAIEFCCPYCGALLSFKRSRKTFKVHYCHNNMCSYYRKSLKSLSAEEFEEYKEHPYRFKLRYVYREFLVDFFKMDIYSLPKNASTLQFRKFSPHIMGLCLTYLVNCNLSTRVTARVMREVHNVSISHVQIANYAKTAAIIVKPFVDAFPYETSKTLVADETYIKVHGLKYYVWFVLDACRKSILGYTVSSTRDLMPCMKVLRMAFDKLKGFPNDALKFISDGYSVYNLALNEFIKAGLPFNLIQVIGLTNEDPISKEYRPFKQIIERFNRTYKASYRITCGFKSDDGSDVHLALYVAFYNFLRPHPQSHHFPLNRIQALDQAPNMPAKWQVLIKMSQEHLVNQNQPA